MSVQGEASTRKTVRDILGFKGGSEAFVCLTSYTAPIARLADRHADLILVGDSVGMVLYGFDSTLPVTLDMMVLHGAAVVRSTKRAFVVVDMPFGSYQESPEQAFRSAARIMAETGCGAVKLEGGSEMAPTVSFLTQRGIPVMGHIGLQPQSVNSAGGYRVTGRNDAERERIIQAADGLAAADAFAIVLECMTPDLAQEITARVAIPTVGIGAAAACDGQILVTEDLLGVNGGSVPKFVRKYSDLAEVTDLALGQFADDVRNRRFPGKENIYNKSKKNLIEAAE